MQNRHAIASPSVKNCDNSAIKTIKSYCGIAASLVSNESPGISETGLSPANSEVGLSMGDWV
jgi:hypothetical protein